MFSTDFINSKIKTSSLKNNNLRFITFNEAQLKLRIRIDSKVNNRQTKYGVE